MGDLTVVKRDPNKYRGIDFPEIGFSRSVRYPECLGNIPTVIAEYASDDVVAKKTSEVKIEDRKVLELLAKDSTISLDGIAVRLLWSTKKGKTNKSKVNRIVHRLIDNKLIDKDRKLTELGAQRFSPPKLHWPHKDKRRGRINTQALAL
jgi:hypothetical protein